ncbi:30S ribosomal protein S20 [Chlamydia sp. 17-3921]|uniref:30S ribosomal protein S20 n=1 Tax=Chlamydia sp. 17-3921 TaxID=2675798 RepID=UPI00191B1659|nr:30S ribosomal protein S20 [Chlamydia sp. 17-3921]
MTQKKSNKNKGPQRQPSAQKRRKTAEKRNLINQSFKSKVKTVLKKFEAALKTEDQNEISQNLSSVYSVVDKAAKRGIFKDNKAARIKSRAIYKINAKA